MALQLGRRMAVVKLEDRYTHQELIAISYHGFNNNLVNSKKIV